MSHKIRDEHNRLRNIVVGFRVSPEENELLNKVVAMSGLTKQEYCYSKCINRDIVVQGNPRVYKALRNNLSDVLCELKRIESGKKIDYELLNLIEVISKILSGLKEESQ